MAFFTFGRLWINPDAIDAVDQGDNNATTLYLRGGQVIMVTGEESKAFRKWFEAEKEPRASAAKAQHPARAIRRER